MWVIASLGGCLLNIYTAYLIWTTVITLRLHVTPGQQDDPDPMAYLLNAVVPGHFWYIWALPVYYLVGLGLARLAPRRPWLFLILAVPLAIHAVDLGGTMRALLPETAEFAYWERTFASFLWFWLGVSGASVLRRFGDGTLPALARFGAVGRVGLFLAALALVIGISIAVSPGTLAALALSACYGIMAFTLFPLLEGSRMSGRLETVGRNTLPIYIFHKLLLVVLMAAESRIGGMRAFLADNVNVMVPVVALALVLVSLGIGGAVRASPLAFTLNGFVRSAPRAAVPAQ